MIRLPSSAHAASSDAANIVIGLHSVMVVSILCATILAPSLALSLKKRTGLSSWRLTLAWRPTLPTRPARLTGYVSSNASLATRLPVASPVPTTCPPLRHSSPRSRKTSSHPTTRPLVHSAFIRHWPLRVMPTNIPPLFRNHPHLLSDLSPGHITAMSIGGALLSKCFVVD